MRAKFWVTKEGKERMGKLGIMWGWYFTHIPLLPQRGDCFEFWLAGSYRQRDHSHQIFRNLVQGFFGVLTPQNLAISIRLADLSNSSVSTDVSHYAQVILVSFHNRKLKFQSEKMSRLATESFPTSCLFWRLTNDANNSVPFEILSTVNHVWNRRCL